MSQPPSIIKQDAFDIGTLDKANERCERFAKELGTNRDTELKHLQAQFMKKGDQLQIQWGQVIDKVNYRIKDITSFLPAYFAYAIEAKQGRFVLSNLELRWQVIDNPIRNQQLYDEFIYSELKNSQGIGLLRKEDIVKRSITGPFTDLQPILVKIIAEYNKAYSETIKKMDVIKQYVSILPTPHERKFMYVLGTIETEEWFFQQNDQLWPQFVELVANYSQLINKEINQDLKKSLPYLNITEDQLLPSIVIENGSVVDPLLDKVLEKRNLLINQKPQFIKIIDQIIDTLTELWSLCPELKLQIIQNGQLQQTSPNIVQITHKSNNESFLIQHDRKQYHVNVFDQPSTIKIPWFVIRRLIDREPLDYFCTFVIANAKSNVTDITLQSVEYLRDHFSHNLDQAKLCKELKRVLTYEVPTNMVLVEKNLDKYQDKHQQIPRYRPEVYQTNHPFQTKHLVFREGQKSLILYQYWKGQEVIIPVNTQIEGIRTFECDDDVPFETNNLKQFVHFLLYWEAQKKELSQTMITDYEQWLLGENQTSMNLRQTVIKKLEEIKFIVSKVEDKCTYEIEVFSCKYEGHQLVKSIEEVHRKITSRQQEKNMENISIKHTVCLAVCLISESQFAVITPAFILQTTYVNVIPESSLQISQNQENLLRIYIQDVFLQEILGNEKQRPNLLAHIILSLQKLPIPQNHILTLTTDHLQKIRNALNESYESLKTQFEQRTQEQEEIKKTMKQFQDLASAVGIEYQQINKDAPVDAKDLNSKVPTQWQQTKPISLMKQILYFYSFRCGDHYVYKYKDTMFKDLLVIYASEYPPQLKNNQITQINFARPMILGIFQTLYDSNNDSLLKALAWIIDVLFTENQALTTPITVDLALLNQLYDNLNKKYEKIRQKDYKIKEILEPIYQYFSVISQDQKQADFGKLTPYPFNFVLILSWDKNYPSLYTLFYSEDQLQNVHNYPIGTDKQLKASTQEFRIDKYMRDILQVDNTDLAIIFFYAMVSKSYVVDTESIERIIELLQEEHTKVLKRKERLANLAKCFIDPDWESPYAISKVDKFDYQNNQPKENKKVVQKIVIVPNKQFYYLIENKILSINCDFELIKKPPSNVYIRTFYVDPLLLAEFEHEDIFVHILMGSLSQSEKTISEAELIKLSTLLVPEIKGFGIRKQAMQNTLQRLQKIMVKQNKTPVNFLMNQKLKNSPYVSVIAQKDGSYHIHPPISKQSFIINSQQPSNTKGDIILNVPSIYMKHFNEPGDTHIQQIVYFMITELNSTFPQYNSFEQLNITRLCEILEYQQGQMQIGQSETEKQELQSKQNIYSEAEYLQVRHSELPKAQEQSQKQTILQPFFVQQRQPGATQFYQQEESKDQKPQGHQNQQGIGYIQPVQGDKGAPGDLKPYQIKPNSIQSDTFQKEAGIDSDQVEGPYEYGAQSQPGIRVQSMVPKLKKELNTNKAKDETISEENNQIQQMQNTPQKIPFVQKKESTKEICKSITDLLVKSPLAKIPFSVRYIRNTGNYIIELNIYGERIQILITSVIENTQLSPTYIIVDQLQLQNIFNNDLIFGIVAITYCRYMVSQNPTRVINDEYLIKVREMLQKTINSCNKIQQTLSPQLQDIVYVSQSSYTKKIYIQIGENKFTFQFTFDKGQQRYQAFVNKQSTIQTKGGDKIIHIQCEDIVLLLLNEKTLLVLIRLYIHRSESFATLFVQNRQKQTGTQKALAGQGYQEKILINQSNIEEYVELVRTKELSENKIIQQ